MYVYVLATHKYLVYIYVYTHHLLQHQLRAQMLDRFGCLIPFTYTYPSVAMCSDLVVNVVDVESDIVVYFQNVLTMRCDIGLLASGSVASPSKKA